MLRITRFFRRRHNPKFGLKILGLEYGLEFEAEIFLLGMWKKFGVILIRIVARKSQNSSYFHIFKNFIFFRSVEKASREIHENVKKFEHYIRSLIRNIHRLGLWKTFLNHNMYGFIFFVIYISIFDLIFFLDLTENFYFWENFRSSI